MFLILSGLLSAQHATPEADFRAARIAAAPIAAEVEARVAEADETADGPDVPEVPFYSQFADIDSPEWKKVGCGVTSLAMVIDYYRDEAVSVNALLARGLAAGAYQADAGWTYAGLIGLGERYDLEGTTHDLRNSSAASALAEFEEALEGGPVIVSVHYRFEPTNPIPHLVVANGIDGDTLYYNDPAEKAGAGEISVADFVAAWKQRFIVIRPTDVA